MPNKQIYFQNDIKKIFKIYVPKYRLSKNVKDVLNTLIIKFTDLIIKFIKNIMKKNNEKTITTKILQKAIIKEIDEIEYSKHLVSEGVKAYTLFSNWKKKKSSKKRTSMSEKARVIISVTKVKKLLKKSNYKVNNEAAVYLSGSLDFIVTDLLELTSFSCGDRNAKTVNITDLYNVIESEVVLNKLFKQLKIKVDNTKLKKS